MGSEFQAVVDVIADPTMPAGLSRERVVRLIQNRSVAGSRVAGRWLVSRTSLRAYLDRHGASINEPGGVQLVTPSASGAA